jgi:hypothetical protein
MKKRWRIAYGREAFSEDVPATAVFGIDEGVYI